MDTHVWIWLSVDSEDRFTDQTYKVLKGESQKWISAISCWELSKLVEKKRIVLTIPTLKWIQRSLYKFNVRICELVPEIAIESTALVDFHSDPADQIIVATSRFHGFPLVTSNKKILQYSGVQTNLVVLQGVPPQSGIHI